MRRLALVLPMLALATTASCLISRVSTWDRITGQTWVLLKIEGEPPLAESRITLRLEEPTQLFGEAGINRYFGSYQRIGQTGFRAARIAGTRMAGSRALMDQEARYLELLQRADEVRYRKAPAGVTLEFLEREATLLVFEPAL